ncbi:NAD(P)-dependent oxidoreductase [Parafrankia sp. FMc2]|uniref:NAD(P)-dependent oxidoreductase n=1 Tax=Parafrankia sp. FMc2 TaxID=3233196 RepID=UPI0034D5656E
MKVGVFGATGTIGRCVVSEALARGHQVTGWTRDVSRLPPQPAPARWVQADVIDPADVARVIAEHDVIVNAINTGNSILESIANAGVLPAAARAVLTAMERHPATRLIVVGGAGSLEVEPGQQLVDLEGFAEGLPAALGVPADYVKVVLAHREALNLYRLSNRKWTYLSPSAGLITSGERTGRFRTGANQILVTAAGTNDISAEDLAVAIVDEVETPRHIRQRFTVGY